ncbi:MAG: CBS domain-containing protein [Planctomycetaceae bacterium]|nr:CBS domain-containing protein [Planctomycetaceae bacterium]
MFVRDRMSAPAVSVSPKATASLALALMDKRKIRRLPVIQDGKLVGIVTRSDLMAARHALSKEAVTTVAHVMTRKPVSVQREDPLEVAADLMRVKKVSGLPVLDGDRLVGILTESDLFRALCQMLGIGEKGARIMMSVGDTEDLLEAVQGRLKNLTVRSLVTMHDPKRSVWDVVMRVRGRSSRSF